MHNAQPAILSPVPPAGRFLTFGLAPGAEGRAALERVARLRLGEGLIAGIGDPLLRAAGSAIAGLRPFPALSGAGGAFPSTQGALWISLGGRDPGDLLLAARKLAAELGELFRVDEDVATFVHG